MDEFADKFENRSENQKALDSWPMPKSEPFTDRAYISEGWEYGDLPRLSIEMFDQFIEIVGLENLRFLTLANYGDTKRGQYLISPLGKVKISEYLASQK